MRKVLVVFCCLLIIAVALGCTSVRTRTITKERVDTEVAGNQGVIYGPTPAPHKVADSTREIIAVDIELPTGEEVFKRKPKSTTPDKTVEGNAGVVSGEQSIK